MIPVRQCTDPLIWRRVARFGLATLIVLCAPSQGAFAQQDFEISDEGRLRLDIRPAESESYQAISRYRNDLQALVTELDGELNLQQDVAVVFAQWPWPELKPDAVYQPNSNPPYILISYGLIDRLRQQGDDSYWVPNIKQTLLHEVGHALLHVNNVPKANPNENEENVADQLAFFIMSEVYENELELVPVVEHYLMRATQGGAGGPLQAESEHIPDERRAENYLCWIDGKSSMFDERLEEVLDERDCEAEYLQLSDAWYTRLEPSIEDEDPAELFYDMLNEGYGVDQVTQTLAMQFDQAVAIDLAVDFCAPIPDPRCVAPRAGPAPPEEEAEPVGEGSTVYNTWSAFLDGVEADLPVDAVLESLAQQGADGALLTGIAVFWCSPEPGFGCEQSRYTQAWNELDMRMQQGQHPADAIADVASNHGDGVASLMAASLCGESTCFRDEFAQLPATQVARLGSLRPQGQAKQRRGELKFRTRPSASTKSTRQKLCGWSFFRWGCG